MSKTAFIGVGNMGSAILRAVCRKTDPSSVWISNRTKAKADALAAEDVDGFGLGIVQVRVTLQCVNAAGVDRYALHIVRRSREGMQERIEMALGEGFVGELKRVVIAAELFAVFDDA